MRKRTAVISLLVAASAIGVLAYLRAASAQAGVAEIRLYTGEEFTGRELVIQQTLYDLPSIELSDTEAFYWNDEIRSVVVVSGTWRLYQNGRCNTVLDDTRIAEFDIRTKEDGKGWSCLVSGVSTGEVAFPSCESGGFHCDISSVELVSEENLPDWAMLTMRR